MKKNPSLGDLKIIFRSDLLGKRIPRVKKKPYLLDDKSTNYFWKFEDLTLFLEIQWSSMEVWRRREFESDKSDFLFLLWRFDLGVKSELKLTLKLYIVVH